jgi:hypothetical protein
VLTVTAARQQHADAMGEALPTPRVTLDAYRRHVFAQLDRYAVTPVWTPASRMPAGAAAYADLRGKRVVCPPIEDEIDVAIVLHELGHHLSEPCKGSRHHKDPKVTNWHHCLACEVDAWTCAIALVKPLPWSRAMHQRLTRSLQIYRRQTPGGRSARRELDALACPIAWFELKQRDVMFGSVTKCQDTLNYASR